MITVVGESLVDVVARQGHDELTVHPGGSPANVAVALSRLGQRTVLVTQIGADDYGALIRTHLENNGVEVILAGPAGQPTSRALATLAAGGAAPVERAAASAHIVKMSDEDLAFLFPGTMPAQLAGRLLDDDRPTQLLVVTMGRDGAMVVTRNSRFAVPAVPVVVVDTVGAGDTFTAALLAGLADAGLLSREALTA